MHDKEAEMQGRYTNKRVDITIMKDQTPITGIGVKFVMQNYSQNSNNYFENMLGETANIRTAQHPYFQIFIIFDELPYYKKDSANTITHWETFTEHNIEKYVKLSHDNTETYFHTPNKTLLYIVHLSNEIELHNKTEYLNYYRQKDFTIRVTNKNFLALGTSVILNDYETFISKVYHTIMSL